MVLGLGAVPALPAFAQSDTGEINILVQDANSKKPIVLARVLLDGPVMTSEFTGDNGKVRFTDVPDGIYRARVVARGFQSVTSENFEIVNGRNVTVTVALAMSQGDALRTIASAVVKSTATISTSSISADSAQRKLSNDLADALNKLSGVSVSTSSTDSDATQTVSLEGQDPSQTQVSVDGIPMNAPGSAGDLRMMNSDLFSGASVSMGPQIGGLAGGVNFRSLDPTLSWQSAFSLSVGSNGKNNYSLAESGSLGKLGIAAMHTYRATPSLLDGMQFLDTSGLFYTHEGDRDSTGTLVKLRYQLSDAQTLTGMYTHSTNGSELVCTQDTGALPCGYGPDNWYNTAFDLYSLTDNALVGSTQLQASFFGSKSTATRDLLDRFIGGVAAPTGSIQGSSFDGFSLNATLPAQQRHTISVSAYTTNSTSTFTPLNAAAQPYTFPGQSASYSAISVNDSIRSNTKLRFNDSIGISRATNAPSSLLLGIGSNWQPAPNDSYALSYNIGGVAPHAGRQGVLSDPGQLRIDCDGNVGFGNAPGDEPGASNSTSARFSYTHRMNGGLVSGSIYRQLQNDVVLPVEVNATALPSALFPQTYWGQVQTVYDTTCGAGILPQQNVYYTTPIAGVRRVYEGAHLNGYFTLGNLVVQPYYDIQVAKAFSSDPRFDNPYAITISGAQLPNVPLHRAGITLDYRAPRSIFEWLADAQYTGTNNQQNLPAYTTVDAGVSATLQHGTLAFVASNIFNTYGGVFSSSQWAVPYTAANGTQVATIAHPNTPRQVSVTYTVRFGQGAQTLNSPGASPLADANGGPGGPGGEGGGRRGFGQFMQPLPSTPPADPFAVNATPLCTSDAQKIAQPILSALKAYAAQIEAAKTSAGYPDSMPAANIPGVSVAYHGMKSTYALSVSVKQMQQMRPMFVCTSFHRADLQTAQQRNLYVDQSGGVFFRPSVTFMPAVGFYFVPRQPQAGAENFRVYKLPATPPATPFALRTPAQSCTPELRTAAQTALALLQAHFTKGTPAAGWTIAAHTTNAGTWYSLEPDDVDAVPALLNCGHVSSATKDELTKLGWDGVTIPSLNYTQKLGIYMIAPQRRGFPGEQRRAEPGASPSPAP